MVGQGKCWCRKEFDQPSAVRERLDQLETEAESSLTITCRCGKQFDQCPAETEPSLARHLQTQTTVQMTIQLPKRTVPSEIVLHGKKALDYTPSSCLKVSFCVRIGLIILPFKENVRDMYKNWEGEVDTYNNWEGEVDTYENWEGEVGRKLTAAKWRTRSLLRVWRTLLTNLFNTFKRIIFCSNCFTVDVNSFLKQEAYGFV